MFPDMPLLPVSMLLTPSTVRLCTPLRDPLTLKPRFEPSAGALATPGTTRVSARGDRPLTARLEMAVESMASDRSALRDCTSTERAVTVTVSVSAPSSSWMMPTDRRSATLSTTFSRSAVLNDSMVTFNRYVSGKRFRNTKSPASFEVATCVSPRRGELNSTVAPGTPAPWASWMVPAMEPRVVWAVAVHAAPSMQAAAISQSG
jgi:hypothetical protein